ncbi:helix-turn-helix domain-containing protein [Nocardioides sp. TRM66260-LWL]|uniref:DNA-3-methyladenine glycosylase 2 family protein n=1 Tax=Nocardioides sp. TRM66260-LWL TaxID=2874478 RepID=UPI001CC7A6BA|nr:AlkA N-terminal domain-containing protein [Nocardioides sp. TRM66260-LWL]MBZ5733123.1 helix-turn-helix domain-containing protein [Nocardioides sp. TRM66260-LWL]
MTPVLDPTACYAAVRSRDRRFDGVFYTAVRTTGIYCRPSCPARTPAAGNVSFHPTAAAAQSAGYRACRRCRPDATPGSPAWDVAADVAGRAMRLIGDGVVDRDGVPGLAARLGYTPRHLGRLLAAELGATPLALARAQRAQVARILLETTTLPCAEVAFAAGFASVRQFNDTVREVHACTPTALRERAAGAGPGRTSGVEGAAGALTPLRLRLAVRTPYAARECHAFLALHAVTGVEAAGADWYARTLDLPHGPGTVRVDFAPLLGAVGREPGVGHLDVTLELADLRDTAAALERTRRLLDADADPVAVDAHLGADPLLAASVEATPGLRMPGQVDGPELAVRAVVGQQVSLAGARTVTGRIVAAHGLPLRSSVPGLTHLFPRPDVLASLDAAATEGPRALPLPRARARALVAIADACARGEVALDRGADRAEVRTALLALPGVGPWTADYVALRALGDPDVWLPGDLAVRRVLARAGAIDGPRDVAGTVARAEPWRPWRTYALAHLWQQALEGVPVPLTAAEPAPPVPSVPSPEEP